MTKHAGLLLEWSGSTTGLLGAGLLATNSAVSGYGFVAFLVSNLFWIGYATSTRAWGLRAMQVGFTATSLVGIWRWFIVG